MRGEWCGFMGRKASNSGTGNGCVTVKTNRGTYEANRIIFCGGAWSGKLLSDLGVKLIVTRQVMGWVWPKQPALFELGTLPVWAIDRPGGSIWYGFPMALRGEPGFQNLAACQRQ